MNTEATFFDFTKPIFQEPPDDTEVWSGFVVGGMAQTDELSLVRSYKLAADALVASAFDAADLSHEFAYPALYLYRHVIELYLKLVVQPTEPNHGIMKLARQFKAVVRSKLKLSIPDWVMERLREFADIDPCSQSFRYAKRQDGSRNWVPGEYWVNFAHLRDTLDALARGFERAYFELPPVVESRK